MRAWITVGLFCTALGVHAPIRQAGLVFDPSVSPADAAKMQAIADDLPVVPDQMVVFDSNGVIMATSPELAAAMEKVEEDPATDPDIIHVLDDRPRP